MHQRLVVPGLLIGLILGWSMLNSARSIEETDEQKIRQVLQHWPTDFNTGNKERTHSLFATDLLACYPG